MKLNQKYKKFQYLAWWVMCSYHQAAVLDENKAINLRLARKYLESVKGDHGEGAYKLYLLILLELGDIDALEEREYLIEMKIILFFLLVVLYQLFIEFVNHCRKSHTIFENLSKNCHSKSSLR